MVSQALDELWDEEPLYQLKKGEADFEELYKILNRANGNVVTFKIIREGAISEVKRRIFSVRNLDINRFLRRERKSILMATAPNKNSGFFIPWEPGYRDNFSDVLQIMYGKDLLFENYALIKKLRLRE
jgi:hypothetical protein